MRLIVYITIEPVSLLRNKELTEALLSRMRHMNVRVGAQVVSVRVIGRIRQKRLIRVQRQPRGMVARPGVSIDADIPVIRSTGASAGCGLIQSRRELDRPCRRIRNDLERAVLPEEVVRERRVRELVAKRMVRGAAGETGGEYSAQEYGVGRRRQSCWLEVRLSYLEAGTGWIAPRIAAWWRYIGLRGPRPC